jgi:hypothetical protein
VLIERQNTKDVNIVYFMGEDWPFQFGDNLFKLPLFGDSDSQTIF